LYIVLIFNKCNIFSYKKIWQKNKRNWAIEVLKEVFVCNSCVKFKAYDQLKDRGDYLEYKEIDEFLLEMTVNNWEGSANRNKDKTANTEIAIWKVKRK
jgi:hypothetical protein